MQTHFLRWLPRRWKSVSPSSISRQGRSRDAHQDCFISPRVRISTLAHQRNTLCLQICPYYQHQRQHDDHSFQNERQGEDLQILPKGAQPMSSACSLLTLQQGMCKYGNKCLNEHVDKSPTRSGDDSARLPSTSSKKTASVSPFRGPLAHQRPVDILPYSSPETRDLIPINKDGERLDTIFLRPPPEAWELYQRRKDQHKLCNKHHLGGGCGIQDCKFDHSDLEPQALTVLQYILKETPCPRGLRCRQARCYAGHVCQKEGCRGGSGSSSRSCRFKPHQHMHRVDFKVAEWVPPVVADGDGEAEDLPECSIILVPERSSAEGELIDGW